MFFNQSAGGVQQVLLVCDQVDNPEVKGLIRRQVSSRQDEFNAFA